MNTVSGLQSALKLCASDKVKDRSQGQEHVREIFSNRENLAAFQETASRDGGAGWVAFFQCLFQVVVVEKKAAVKKGASAQADRRLAEAISLVRWMAERSVHLISRKPFIALFTHMTHLLVFASTIFPPAALDYAKALRSVLSYPPHLENLDQQGWKILMGICWAAVLGDPVTVDDEWQEDNESESVNQGKGFNDISTQNPLSSRTTSTVSQSTTELVSLIPILLSSTAAPLISPLPPVGPGWISETSLGHSILLKIHRFFLLHPTETSAHLPILRSMNIVLTELELNCRADFVSAGIKLFPQLVEFWGTRDRGLREQVLIALKTLLPYLTHKVAAEKDKAGVIREAMNSLMEALPREASSRSGIRPLDFGVLRLKEYVRNVKAGTSDCWQPFESITMSAGFDFSHESAMTWAVLELYADVCYQLYQGASTPPSATPNRTNTATPTQDGPTAKRRKVGDVLATLVLSINEGPHEGRVIGLQVLNAVIHRYWAELHSEAQIAIRQAVVDLLNEDHVAIQSWAFLDLAAIAVTPQESSEDLIISKGSPASPSQQNARRKTEESDWSKVWAHGVRKASITPLSRAACHTAHVLLQSGRIPTASCVQDVSTLLQNVDIQGPPYPFDSVCAFLKSALRLTRSDLRLYAMDLEDKLLSWLAKWDALEGSRGKGRMDPQTPADLLLLLSESCRLPSISMHRSPVLDSLPDCAIVDHVLRQAETRSIRDFILYGRIPDTRRPEDENMPLASMPKAGSNRDLYLLEGPPQLATQLLSRNLRDFCVDWGASEQPAASLPERVRRSIDLVVLVLAFQACLELGGIRPDDDCNRMALDLLKRIQPCLAATPYTVSGQNLIWQGFEPLCYTRHRDSEIWPILLRPDIQSGVRQDILPPNRYETAPARYSVDADRKSGDHLQSVIWSVSATAAAFKEVFDICRTLLEHGNPAIPLFGSQATAPNILNDDDFGEIRTAESEVMPQSKEVLECRRATTSLLGGLARLRLTGATLSSPVRQPFKDTQLINAFLSAEGARFIQLGTVVCSAIKDGTLYLNAEAVELILASLEEMLSSYAYSRDEGLLRLALSFMTCSMPYWLVPELSTSDLTDRVVYLAKFLATKALRDQVPSWRVRLAILLFADEYLDYDPSFSAWSSLQMDDATDDDAWGPLAVTSGSLLDRDGRVRFRAATSTAGLFYLQSIPPGQHYPFYQATMNRLPRQPKHWDSFITDIVWKLNCCVTSAQLRAATIYHLYEVPLSSSDFNHHLQIGLAAVAQRLGLDGISTLYLPYAALVVRSQLGVNQSPMRVPYRVYGSSSHKAFAASLLGGVSPSILAAINGEAPCKDGNRAVTGARELFASLCEAASLPLQEVVKRHLPATLALVSANLVEDATFSPDKDLSSPLIDALTALPGITAEADVDRLVPGSIDLAAAYLFGLVDLEASALEIGKLLDTRIKNGEPGSLFVDLMRSDVSSAESPPALHPSFPTGTIINAYGALSTIGISMSTSKMVFNALANLFHRLNETFLVSEQRRYLRSIALVTATHQAEYRQPAVLEMSLREAIMLLDRRDICALVLSFVKWGLQQIPKLSPAIGDLADIFIRLGAAWNRLKGLDNPAADVADDMESWISRSALSWQNDEAMVRIIPVVLTLWPSQLAQYFKSCPEPTFGDLCDLAASSRVDDVSILMKRLVGKLTEGNLQANVVELQQRAFWHLKKAINPASFDEEGLVAFLDVLYIANGQVHAPSLEAIKGLVSNVPYDSLVTALKKEPAVFLHAVVVNLTIRLTAAESYETRGTALLVLQRILPFVGDMHGRKILSPEAVDLMSHLVPIDVPWHSPRNQQVNALSEDQSLVKLSRVLSAWSTSLAAHLCELIAAEDPFYYAITPLLSDAASASDLLPFLVQACLSCGSEKSIKERVRLLSDHLSSVLQYPSAGIETVRAILKIILHLRHFHPPYRPDLLGYNAWLKIDFLLLSEAAIKCGAFATALLFLESAVPSDNLDLYNSRVQKTMYAIYSNVEDPDGFYGVKTHDVESALHRRLEHEGDYWRSIGVHGAIVESTLSSISAAPSMTSAARDFHKLGFNHIANAVLRNAGSGTSADPFVLDLAWRTADWDLPLNADAASTSQGLLYSALRTVHRERDQDAARLVALNAVRAEVGRLQGLGMERMAEIKQTTANLLCLREIVHWLSPEVQIAVNEGDFAGDTLRSFAELRPSLEFRHAERLSATRQSLLRATRARVSQDLLGDLSNPLMDGLAAMEKACYLRLGAAARLDGETQAAMNAITAVRGLERNGSRSDTANDEYSHVLWSQREHSLAIQHVEEMVGTLLRSGSKDRGRQAVLLARIANWTSEAKLRSAQEIQTSFHEAYTISTTHKISATEQARLCHDYATFADHRQAALSRSPELERLYTYVSRKQAELEQSPAPPRPASKRKRDSAKQDEQTATQRELEEDQKAIAELLNEQTMFVKTALRMYAAAFMLSDEHDDSTTRLCSLWLQHDINEDINKGVVGALDRVPPHKFIFLGPQLAARLDRPKKPTAFNTALNGLMLRMSRQHPYHILFQIITLASGMTLPSTSRRLSDSGAEGRGPAAAGILATLAADNGNPLARTATKQMKLFAEAATTWSLHKEPNREEAGWSDRNVNLPSGCPVASLQGMSIPVATAPPPVDIVTKYAGIPTLVRYKSRYSVLGGLHRPKKMYAVDSLQKVHSQLFKGDDEVRQDAVMEQVFEMSNAFLSRDRKTKVRDLRFRTYVVIPLTQKTGVLEFVGDSQGIGEWLKPAHARYGQSNGDIRSDKFRNTLKPIQEKDENSRDLVLKYTQMIQQFHPVMRHFFTEKHKDPMAWFAMRLNYTRSVAVASMVGWVLGIGDRHCSNILIDTITGELVHIDFGIVFEEGRRLRIPEKVPFRLTSDIVDGLGITGVDGTFRRCSEHTLRVLRESSELIMTVLEVFKHDPLYAWTGDPDKLQRAQGGGRVDLAQSATVQEKADRVLSRIRQKLRDDLSVEYRVNQLIQEARDVESLAKIFVGWQSWF